MNYFIDCEFDGFGGKLLSLALVPLEPQESLYIVLEQNVIAAQDPWVIKNVIPIIKSIPQPFPGNAVSVVSTKAAADAIASYLSDDPSPNIIADWPDDIKYFCDTLITGPGFMVNISTFTTQLIRVDSYPTKIKDAIQHNAYWDALALKDRLT